MPEHSTPNNKVVVVGGGYAGAVAANRLRMRGDVDITVVNPRARFVDRVRLHQFVAGTGEAEVNYGTLLGDEVRLVVDSATRIDTAARTVELASGRALEHDYVIYAAGSTGATSSVPGVAEFAFSVAEFELAQRLRARLDEMPLDAPVTVVDTVLSRIAGTEPAVLSVAFSGACVSLGRRSAVRQLAGRDDSPVNVYVGGRLGAAIKELTCKFGVAKIRREARRPGSLIWPKGGPRQATAAREVTSP